MNDGSLHARIVRGLAHFPDASLVEAESISHFCGIHEALVTKPFTFPLAIAGQSICLSCAADAFGGVALTFPVPVPHPVELLCSSLIGVHSQQAVEFGDGFGRRLADQCDRPRQLRFECQALASAHAKTDRDLVAVPGQRRIFDQKPEQPFSVSVAGLGSMPDLLEVPDQFPDALDLALGEFGITGCGARFALLAGLLQNTQPIVPFSFERSRDEPVGGIDLEEPAARHVGLVAHGLDSPGALGIGAGKLRTDLFLDRKSQADVLSVHHVNHEAGHFGIDKIAAHALAGLSTVANEVFLASAV